MIERVLESIAAGRNSAVESLKEFLRFPSVSTRPEHAGDIQQCAGWLAEQLRGLGLTASVEPTGGHPVVLARNQHRPGRPTVLMYGHYDVQPPEPLDLWQSPPFEPTIRNGAVYARGAVDDKGQVWAHVEAIRAWQQAGEIPVNLIMLVEGEEEIGSDNLEHFLQSHRDKLKADIAVISDTGQFARGVPAITYGLRGLVYMEVFITSVDRDLHSGMYGGSVANPANVLTELLATLHDSSGRVNIPGFYDDVIPLRQEEREQWKRLPFDEVGALKEIGAKKAVGEEGYSSLERRWGRPTCDINGLTSGYQDHGAKTIIPAKASAKISMRLVPGQDPRKIRDAFVQTLKSRCPDSVKIEFAEHGLGGAIMVPIDSRAMSLANRAVEKGFGKRPVLIREGGSIPVVAEIKSTLGIDTLLVGFGLPDDCVHAPNEKFDLDALYNGTRTLAVLYDELSRL